MTDANTVSDIFESNNIQTLSDFFDKSGFLCAFKGYSPFLRTPN